MFIKPLHGIETSGNFSRSTQTLPTQCKDLHTAHGPPYMAGDHRENRPLSQTCVPSTCTFLCLALLPLAEQIPSTNPEGSQNQHKKRLVQIQVFWSSQNGGQNLRWTGLQLHVPPKLRLRKYQPSRAGTALPRLLVESAHRHSASCCQSVYPSRAWHWQGLEITLTFTVPSLRHPTKLNTSDGPRPCHSNCCTSPTEQLS